MTRRATKLAAMTATLVTVAAVALAFFIASGAGSAGAAVGSLDPATISAPGTTGGSTAISWTAQAAVVGATSQNPSITYTVERKLGSGSFAAVASGPCSSALPYGTTACTDTVAADGTYQYRVVARFRTWTATSNTRSVSVATAHHFAVSSPGTTTAGSTFTVTATAQSAANATVTDYTGAVVLSAIGGAGSVVCTSNTATASAGVATFTGCHIDTAGAAYQLHAAAGAITGDSAAFAITAAAASKLAFTTQPSSGTGGTALATQPVVAVQDTFGNPVTGSSASITLALTTPAGAALTCTTNPLAASGGIAAFAGCKVDKTGTYTLTATSGGLTSATSSSFTITVGAAAKLAITTQPSASSVSQTAFAQQPVVTVQDAGGNTVTTDASNVTLGLNIVTGGPGVLACTANPKSATSGVATFAGCKVDKVGTYTLTATDGALASATTPSFSITIGAAAKLAVTTQPSSTSTAATAFTQQPVVTVQDAGGNTVTTDASNVTLALNVVSDGPGTLTCTANPKAAVSGVATFAGCKVDKVGTYTVTATDGSLTSAVSNSFTITVGAATTVTVSSGAGQSANTGSAFANPLVALVTDAGGNPVSGVSVTFTAPGTGASGTFAPGATLTTSAASNASGLATSTTFTANATTGTYTVTAAASGTTTASFSLTNQVDTFTVSASSPQTAGTAFNVTITAKNGGVTDTAYTGSKTIVFTGPASSPNGTAPTYPATVSFSSGVGTASVTLVKAETATITATQGAITGTSGNIVVNATTASTFLMTNCAIGGSATTCGSSFSQGNTSTLTFNVAVRDAFGNTPAATTVTVGLGLTGNGSVFSFASGSAVTSSSVTITSGTQSGTVSVFKRASANDTQTLSLSATNYTTATFGVTK